MKGLKDRIAVVSGAASGLGKAIAIRLLEEGCRVAGIDLKEPDPITFSRYGDCSRSYTCDITDDEGLSRVAACIRQELGAPSILVNNAAVFIFNGADATVEEIDQSCQVNIRGTSRLTHYILPFVREAGGGSIVNISSISGFIGQPDFATYNATKFAIRGMTKCWAVDLAKDNIRVNSVCPGYIRTAAFENYCDRFSLDYEAENQRVGALHILGRQGKPGEVAAAVAFLASEEASFITAADLLVDGGYVAR